MGRGKGWTAILGMVVCVALVSTAVLAEKPKCPGKCKDKCMCSGKGKQAGHRMGKGPNMRGMGSEALVKEFEKFQTTMKAYKEEADAFREKVKKAVQTAHQGEGKPTLEMVKEAVAPYQAEAKQIATKMIDEMIRHSQAVVSIRKAERTQMINRWTKGLLMPRGGPGGGKNLRRKGADGGPERRRRGGNVKIQPAKYDVEIDIPE